MKRTYLLIILSIIFIGCAEKSGVYPSGEESYTISNQAATGFSGMQDIRAEAYTEANNFCKNMNKDFIVILSSETEPPYILGNYPRIDLKFKCK